MVFSKIAATTSCSDAGKLGDQQNGFVTDARSQAGFSLIELALTMFVLTIIVGFAVFGIGNSLRGLNTNKAVQQVAATLRESRQRAMSMNRNHRLRFVGADQIVVERWCTDGDRTSPLAVDSNCTGLPAPDWSVPSMANPSLTLVDQSAFTRNGQASPEGFGSTITEAVDFEALDNVMFTPEGSLVQETNPDIIVNGTIYVGHQNDTGLMRAVTVLGSVGRIRTWTWNATSSTWKR